MAKDNSSKQKEGWSEQEEIDWYERTHKHWRSWGSWYSWGSPVGLGLFLLALAGIVWILSTI